MFAYRCNSCNLINWMASEEEPAGCILHGKYAVKTPDPEEITFTLLNADEVRQHRKAGGLGIYAASNVKGRHAGAVACIKCGVQTTKKMLTDTGGFCLNCAPTEGKKGEHRPAPTGNRSRANRATA